VLVVAPVRLVATPAERSAWSTDPSLILAPVTAPSAILPAVTAFLAILPVTTEPAFSCAAPTLLRGSWETA
jgi:hypothetical protein